jgi:hypothetical protein
MTHPIELRRNPLVLPSKRAGLQRPTKGSSASSSLTVAKTSTSPISSPLDSSGFECFIDREGISGGEAWKRRLGNLISEADTVVFVLSPGSARSETCNWEVEEAARLNKRILPANWRPLEGLSPPPRLQELNYIFFYKEPKVPGSGFGTGLAWSLLSTPILIGCANTPATFSAQSSGTRAGDRRTGCCQATTSSTLRLG